MLVYDMNISIQVVNNLAPSSSILDSIRSLVIIFSPVLVVVGWYFVDRTNNQRESRKELHTLINDFNKFADEVTEMCVEYLVLDDQSAADILKMKIKRQEKLLVAMYNNIRDMLSLENRDYIAYRNILTSTFDEPTKKVYQEDSEEMKQLYFLLSNLKINIQNEFYEQSLINKKLLFVATLKSKFSILKNIFTKK